MRTLTHHDAAADHMGWSANRAVYSAEVLLEYRRQLHEDEAAYFKSMNVDLAAQTAPVKPGGVTDRLSFGDGDAQVASVTVFDEKDQPCSLFHPGETVRVRVECVTHVAQEHLNIGLRIRNKEGIKVYSWGTLNQDISINNGLMQGEVFWEKKFIAGERIVVDFLFECRLGTNLYEIQAAISREESRTMRTEKCTALGAMMRRSST